jgi:pimeloyl-ACP methyl ester carboxylesterase
MRIILAVLLFCCTWLSAKGEELCLPVTPVLAVRGVLELPSESSDKVAIIIPGTHTLDRDGPPITAVRGEGFYAGMARHLLARGMAVLRLDQPFPVASGTLPCTAPPTVSDKSLAAERAAYRAGALWARQTRHFKQVILVGHSQGGIIAAQLAGGDTRLADAVFIVGMTLGPLEEMSRYMIKNIPISAFHSLFGKGERACIANAQLLRHRTELEQLLRPAERWLAPSGAWCPENIRQLEQIFDGMIAQAAQAADQCNNSQDHRSIGEIGNACDEVRLFFSRESIAALLRSYKGPVGVAYGIWDTHLALGREGEAFRAFNAQSAGPRYEVLLDMGHAFGSHPYLGPAQEQALADFAAFVAGPSANTSIPMPEYTRRHARKQDAAR